jgi:hypothetical protein
MTSRKRKNSNSRSNGRRLTVRGIRRDPPDIQKLSKAVIGLAMAQAEREAQAEQTAREAAAKEQTSPEGDHEPGRQPDV